MSQLLRPFVQGGQELCTGKEVWTHHHLSLHPREAGTHYLLTITSKLQREFSLGFQNLPSHCHLSDPNSSALQSPLSPAPAMFSSEFSKSSSSAVARD